ncbi:uncharacterized protein LOC144455019 [Phascolarctos cinereus]
MAAVAKLVPMAELVPLAKLAPGALPPKPRPMTKLVPTQLNHLKPPRAKKGVKYRRRNLNVEHLRDYLERKRRASCIDAPSASPSSVGQPTATPRSGFTRPVPTRLEMWSAPSHFPMLSIKGVWILLGLFSESPFCSL